MTTYKAIPIRLSADISTKTLHGRRKWHNILKVTKGKNLQPRIPSKTLIQDLTEKSKAFQTNKS